MTDERYKITKLRLNALSPAEQKIAEDAIKYGLWQLVDEPKSAEAHHG